mgnify:CR=1 FL=1
MLQTVTAHARTNGEGRFGEPREGRCDYQQTMGSNYCYRTGYRALAEESTCGSSVGLDNDGPVA